MGMGLPLMGGLGGGLLLGSAMGKSESVPKIMLGWLPYKKSLRGVVYREWDGF